MYTYIEREMYSSIYVCVYIYIYIYIYREPPLPAEVRASEGAQVQ